MLRTKVAVCVCSVGIDSTVAATIALQEGYDLHLFHASYGQRAETSEKEAVEKIAAYLGAEELKHVKIPFSKELGWLWPLGTEKKGSDTCCYFNEAKNYEKA